MANFFGFEIRRASNQEAIQDNQPTFAPEVQDDGAVVVAAVVFTVHMLIYRAQQEQRLSS